MYKNKNIKIYKKKFLMYNIYNMENNNDLYLIDPEMEELRKNILNDYEHGLTITNIVSKYQLYRESQFNGRDVRMNKKQIEYYYNIKFPTKKPKKN